MVNAIGLDRKTRNYGEILDVCEYLMEEYGSAANALAAIARRSPLYQETIASPRYREWLNSTQIGEVAGETVPRN